MATTKVPNDEALRNLRQIDHIVVLMMENRSFDHMLGFLTVEEERTDVDGPTLDLFNAYNGVQYKVHPARSTQLIKAQDPDHSSAGVADQLEEGNSGFVRNYVETRSGAMVGSPDIVMAYHTGDQLPVYRYLAEQFCVCDHWFCSVPGATMPNRCYAVAGTSGGTKDNHHPPRPYNFSSFARHLSRAKVSWRWYSHDYTPMLWMIDPVFGLSEEAEPAYFDRPSPLGHRSFLQKAAEGDLPAVSWIDPNFVDLTLGPAGSNDDHPPGDLRAGQKLVLDVFHALVRSRQWPKTMLIVTYDEHGGFYDHIPPPDAPDDRENMRKYGPRVPALVISPWVKRRDVWKGTLDHTSIIKTILARFCRKADGTIPDMGTRVRQADHLGMLLKAPRARRANPLTEYEDLLAASKSWVERLNQTGVQLHLDGALAGAPDFTDFQRDFYGMKRELLAARTQVKAAGLKIPKL
jgi:phospholipase C